MTPRRKAADKDVTIPGSRIARLIDVLATLTTGNYETCIEVDETKEDFFTQVEFAINFLIEQLNYERKQTESKQKELQTNLKTIRAQQEAILDLSTPSLKIWEKVLVIPLVGALDTRRSQRLTEELLQKINSTQAKLAIIDITGVPAVDSAVADHLLKTVSAVRLLGAKCAVTCIRPEVAQTIVHLGVDVSGVETLSNLSEGLKWAFEHLRADATMGMPVFE